MSHENSFGGLSWARASAAESPLAQPMALKCGFPATQKGGVQSSRASGYKSKGGDVILSCEWARQLRVHQIENEERWGLR